MSAVADLFSPLSCNCGLSNKFDRVDLCCKLKQIFACRGKTNFFERRVGEYQRSGVMSALQNRAKASTQKEYTFTLSEDF